MRHGCQSFLGKPLYSADARWRPLSAYQRQEALQRLAAGETMADVARTYAVDAATISRLAASSPFEQGAVGGLRVGARL